MNLNLAISLLFMVLFGLPAVLAIQIKEATTNVYLFSRSHDKPHNLTFIGNRTSSLGSFNLTNTVCAQQSFFTLPNNPLNSFHVIELEDILAQQDGIFSKVPNDTEIIVVNSTDYTWYFWSTSGLSLISGASEYEAKKGIVSHVCYIDDVLIPPFALPSLSLLTITSHIVLVLAFLGVFSSFLAILGICHECLAFQDADGEPDAGCLQVLKVFLSFLSFLFCFNAVLGFFIDTYSNRAELSLLCYWSSSICILGILLWFVLREKIRELVQKSSNSEGTQTALARVFGAGVFVLVIVLAILIFSPLKNMIGSDAASTYSLHFYANTLFKTHQEIYRNSLIIYAIDAGFDFLIIVLSVVFYLQEGSKKWRPCQKNFFSQTRSQFMSYFVFVTLFGRLISLPLHLWLFSYSTGYYTRWIFSVIQFVYVFLVFLPNFGSYACVADWVRDLCCACCSEASKKDTVTTIKKEILQSLNPIFNSSRLRTSSKQTYYTRKHVI